MESGKQGVALNGLRTRRLDERPPALNAKSDRAPPVYDCDLLIRNAYVITLDKGRTVYPSGAVAIRGNKITDVGREKDVVARVRPRHVLDAHGAPVHPGLIDTHYHASLHMTRGAVTDNPAAFTDLGDEPHPYSRWFNAMTDEDEYASCSLAAVEMLRNGYTTFVEGGTVFEPDACAKAAEEVGIRASVTEPFLWDVTDGLPMAKEIDRTPADSTRALDLVGSQLWRNRDPDALVRGHVTLYGMGTATDELTLAAKACADEHKVLLSQHQCMASDDAQFDFERFGKNPLLHFAEIGALGRNVAFVHMNIIQDDEIPAIAESGMSIVWHPGNYQFYSIAQEQRSPMPKLLDRGVNLTFGTDVAKVWSFGDLPWIGYLVAREEGCYLPAERILEMQTIGAARAIVLDHMIGSLEPGKRADLVIRTEDLAEAQPALSVIREMVLVSRSKSVDTVIVDGRIVVRHGRLTLADEDLVYRRSGESARRLAALVGPTPGTVWPTVN